MIISLGVEHRKLEGEERLIMNKARLAVVDGPTSSTEYSENTASFHEIEK